jgi:hypothetical protein
VAGGGEDAGGSFGVLPAWSCAAAMTHPRIRGAISTAINRFRLNMGFLETVAQSSVAVLDTLLWPID